MELAFERCYAAVTSRDPRFDGWFVVAVTSTRIYCRPSCPAMTPRRANVRFYQEPAAAHRAGFRACKRCRPDSAPGSPEWDVRGDVVGRAMRMIGDGVVDRHGVTGLAQRLGYSSRHVTRLLVDEVGAGPLAVARAQRARTARVLIETTALPMAQVAFAAGFASVRQFNETIRAVYAASPTDLRRRGGHERPAAETLALRLPHRRPAAMGALLEHVGARAVAGVEAVGTDGTYTRSLVLPRGAGVVRLRPDDGHVSATMSLDDLRDLGGAVRRCRSLLDLDADPVAVDAHLAADPALHQLVRRRPGLRIPGTTDPEEWALRAVLGQQVSVAAARTLAGRLVARLGMPLPRPTDGVTHRFPTPEQVVEADLGELGLPGARQRALRGLATALAEGRMDLGAGADREAAREALLALPGIGPWTAEVIALRALGDPDAFPASDLALRQAASAVGLPDAPRDLLARAEAWRPWRGVAAQHLWHHAATLPAARAA